MLKVVIRFTFIGFHCWPDAPDFCHFLRNEHRHEFHVEMHWPVTHTDRDIEFITQKKIMMDWVRDNWEGKDLGSMSCEDMCKALHELSPESVLVSVFEDGENGAIYEPV